MFSCVANKTFEWGNKLRQIKLFLTPDRNKNVDPFNLNPIWRKEEVFQTQTDLSTKRIQTSGSLLHFKCIISTKNILFSTIIYNIHIQWVEILFLGQILQKKSWFHGLCSTGGSAGNWWVPIPVPSTTLELFFVTR